MSQPYTMMSGSLDEYRDLRRSNSSIGRRMETYQSLWKNCVDQCGGKTRKGSSSQPKTTVIDCSFPNSSAKMLLKQHRETAGASGLGDKPARNCGAVGKRPMLRPGDACRLDLLATLPAQDADETARASESCYAVSTPQPPRRGKHLTNCEVCTMRNAIARRLRRLEELEFQQHRAAPEAGDCRGSRARTRSTAGTLPGFQGATSLAC